MVIPEFLRIFAPMRYEAYQYIYPPRPANAIPPSSLPEWDNGTMIAQPKLNGSNCVLFTDGRQVLAMNRHGQRLTNFRLDPREVLSSLAGRSGGWTVLNGEYLNKSKTDEAGRVVNHRLVIFDVLVWDSEYLVGSTFEERARILDRAFGEEPAAKHYLTRVSDSIDRVRSYRSGFAGLFDGLTRRGSLVEGVVLKRAAARLEVGNTEGNNSRSQVKSRAQSKNYKF